MDWKAYAMARWRAFGYAFRGLAVAARAEAHVQIELAWAAGIVTWGVWERVALAEWALLASAMALVLTAELLNTAIEAVVDLASPDRNPLAGRAKDVSAAAVLITVFYAVAVTLIVFGPRIWARIT